MQSLYWRAGTAVALALLLLAALFWLVRRQNEPESGQRKGLAIVSAELRQQVLDAKRGDLGLVPTATPSTPWGVVMETGYPEGYATLVALSDGSASLYLSSGGGSIGGGDHQSIRAASQVMVALAARYQPEAKVARGFAVPAPGQTTFYLLTDVGVFTTSANEEDLGEGRHVWSPLFHAGHDVITQYRAVAGR